MKEYCIFKEGQLVFTVNSLNGVDHYVNDDSYIIVESEQLDPSYAYTLVDGVIVKGDKWPVPPPIS